MGQTAGKGHIPMVFVNIIYMCKENTIKFVIFTIYIILKIKYMKIQTNRFPVGKAWL